MMLLVSLVLVFVSSSMADPSQAAAVAKFKTMVHQAVDGMYTTVDSNKDGRFDKADMTPIFTQYDVNHDKEVSEKEFVDQFAANQKDLSIIAKGLFIELDMNRSGAITSSDLDLYFKKIDQNDDGKVEKSEFDKYFTELFTALYILQARQTHTSV